MSTKALEEAIGLLADETAGHYDTVLAARAELEAIRKAARTVGKSDLRIEYLGKAKKRRAEVRAGVEFLRDIAEESP